MTISTLVLKAPVDLNSLPDHPALDFYAKYGKDFQEHFHTCDPEKYYNANCLMYAVDRAKMHGASTMWNFFGTLYADFPHVSREWISMIIVSDDEAGRHTIHAEMLTTVYPQGKEHRGIVIPQSFVYVLGKADEGKGTNGLQYFELRNYYDYGLLHDAKAAMGLASSLVDGRK